MLMAGGGISAGYGNDVLSILNTNTGGIGLWMDGSRGASMLNMGMDNDSLIIEGQDYAIKATAGLIQMGNGDDSISAKGGIGIYLGSGSLIDTGFQNDQIFIESVKQSLWMDSASLASGSGNDAISASSTIGSQEKAIVL